MESEKAYQTAPLLDMISFGYRRVFQHIKPLTMVSLPWMLLVGVVNTLCFSDVVRLNAMIHNRIQPDLATDLPTIVIGVMVNLLILLVSGYLNYVYLRYVRDSYSQEAPEHWSHYIWPDREFWGYIGLFAIYVAAYIPICIALVLGFILFVLPGLLILCGVIYLYVRLSLCGPATQITYFLAPEKGIMKALAHSWRLTANQFWRTFALGTVVLIMQIILLLPFSLFQQVIQLVTHYKPGLASLFVFQLLYGVLFSIYIWGQNVISRAGALFVWYRYYYDLADRMAGAEQPESLPQAS